jgi:hypothetical protein
LYALIPSLFEKRFKAGGIEVKRDLTAAQKLVCCRNEMR